jgi:hypothetical protein
MKLGPPHSELHRLKGSNIDDKVNRLWHTAAAVMAQIARDRDMDADESSDLSHSMVGWKATEMDEQIPYASIFLSDAPLSGKEMEYARVLLTRARSRGLPVE